MYFNDMSVATCEDYLRIRTTEDFTTVFAFYEYCKERVISSDDINLVRGETLTSLISLCIATLERE